MVSPRLHSALLVLVLLVSLAAWLTTRRDAEPASLKVLTAAADAEMKGGEGGVDAVRLEPIKLEMTAYTSDAAQTDATPTLTASGAVAGPGTAAASRDLLGRMPYGSRVEVVSVSGEGCGGWVPEAPLTIADTMSERIRNHLDIWLETSEQALDWGRCRAEVRIVSSTER